MAVYVDNMEASFERMTMCHMLADTSEELLAMADTLGLKRQWIQKPGTAQEHFDICLSKRAKAVEKGAKEITLRETGLLVRSKRAILAKTEMRPEVDKSACETRMKP